MSASLARWTLAPVAWPIIATRGTFCHGRLGGLTSTPRFRSIGPGAAMVMLRTFSRPRWRSISVAAQSTIAWGVARRCVLVLMLATSRPSERASATRTWVPPRSIPASMAPTRLSVQCLGPAGPRHLRGQQLLTAERLQDRNRGFGPVERVEVQARHASLQELRALLDTVAHAELADRLVVGRLVDRQLQRMRNAGAGHRGHDVQGAPARDRHQTRHDRQLDAGVARATHEVEVKGIVEEQLRDEKVRSALHLQSHVAHLVVEVRAFGVFLGAASRADAEAVAAALHEGDQVARVREVRI